MLQLLQYFQNENWQLHFVSTAEFSDRSLNFDQLQIKASRIALNDDGFDRFITEFKPDMVLFDRFITEEQFGWKVSEYCPDAVKVLDTEDLHFLRKAREKAFKSSGELSEAALVNDAFVREMASIFRCDLTLIISKYEMELLISKFKVDPQILIYLPLFAEADPTVTAFSERKNFISIGNFLHEPNWQTVLRLKKIWPAIREKIPEAEMHVYGAYAGPKAFNLSDPKENFIVKGYADDLQQIFSKSRVMLAPIPFGAGIKGKLLDSMRYGLPNVTTAIGAEGMHGEMAWNGFIADEDAEFIAKAVELYCNEQLWEEARQSGFRIVKELFSEELWRSQLAAKLRLTAGTLQDHRNRNFLGRILQHHTLQSTKYLSRWIEEKNRHK